MCKPLGCTPAGHPGRSGLRASSELTQRRTQAWAQVAGSGGQRPNPPAPTPAGSHLLSPHGTQRGRSSRTSLPAGTPRLRAGTPRPVPRLLVTELRFGLTPPRRWALPLKQGLRVSPPRFKVEL